MDKQAFFARVQSDIETATARLVAEAKREGAGKRLTPHGMGACGVSCEPFRRSAS